MASIAALMRDSDALKDQQIQLRAKKRCLRQQERRAAKRSRTAPRHKQAAGLLADMTAPRERAEVLAEFWGQFTPGGSEPGAADHDPAATESPPGSEVADALTTAPGDIRPGGWPAEAWPRRTARRFWQQRKLRDWVRGVNKDVGVAPSTAHVWNAYRGLACGLEKAPDGLLVGSPAAGRRATQWVRRWRRRWRLRRQAAQPGAGLSPALLRDKARRKTDPEPAGSGAGVPKSGSIFGARKRPPAFLPVERKSPFSGPENGPHFGNQFGPRNHFPEALATLRWDRFVATARAEGLTPLRINMDESSIKMWPGSRAGTVVPPSPAPGPAGPPLEVRVPLRARRSAVSLVAFVCDDDDVQRQLPQFIVTNTRMAPAVVAQTWAAADHAPIRLWRQKSAWLTGPALSRMLREVARAIRPATAGRRVIFSMDACPVHLTSAVLRTLAACGWHFLPIAAQMTKYLQPCDVGVFLPLKRRYRSLYEREQLLERCGEVPSENALPILAEAARQIISGGSWGPTFRRCGLSQDPPTSVRFLAALGPAPLPSLHAGAPTMGDLNLVLPRKRSVPVDLLFPLLLRPPGMAPARAARSAGRLPRLRPLHALTTARRSLGGAAPVHVAAAHAESAAAVPAPAAAVAERPRHRIPVAVPLWGWRAPRPRRPEAPPS
jgi:hypothetical protein